MAARTERRLLEQYDRLGATHPRVVWSSMDLPDPVLTQAAFALFPLREILHRLNTSISCRLTILKHLIFSGAGSGAPVQGGEHHLARHPRREHQLLPRQLHAVCGGAGTRAKKARNLPRQRDTEAAAGLVRGPGECSTVRQWYCTAYCGSRRVSRHTRTPNTPSSSPAPRCSGPTRSAVLHTELCCTALQVTRQDHQTDKLDIGPQWQQNTLDTVDTAAHTGTACTVSSRLCWCSC